jgi:hypothetical protein
VDDGLPSDQDEEEEGRLGDAHGYGGTQLDEDFFERMLEECEYEYEKVIEDTDNVDDGFGLHRLISPIHLQQHLPRPVSVAGQRMHN